MRGFAIAALTITAFNPMSANASTVIVKPGDTLSEIALKNNVQLTELLELNRIENINELRIGQKIIIPNLNHDLKSNKMTYTVRKGDTINSIALRLGMNAKELIKLNKIKKNEYIYEGQIIKLTESNHKSKEVESSIHTVQSGDTIGGIAINYNSSIQSIIRSNNINDPRNIYPGQKLKIPVNTTRKLNTKFFIKNKTEKPKFHILSEGETLFSISKKYNLPLNKILEVNSFNNPNQLEIGRRINLTNNSNIGNNLQSERKRPQWRTYGPLRIDWSNWQVLEGSYVTPTLNTEGKALYLAVNCNAKRLNATGANGTWKNWIEPIDQFEHDLINDLCVGKKS